MLPVFVLLLAVAQSAHPARDETQSAHPARDETTEARAVVEVDAPAGEVYVGQRVSLSVRFAIEEGFLERNMVQPFGAALDVPVQVTWPGVEVRDEETTGRVTFAWNESVRGARRIEDRVVAERTYRVYSAEAEVLATAAGSLALPAPVLAYAYATRFEDGLLSGRVAADRVDAFATGRGLELRVSALPEQGRPPEFTGAVGRFTIEAEATPRNIELGQSLRLTLRVRGRGNFDSIEEPHWKELGGFRVLGVVASKSVGERAFVLDLAPYSASVWQIPSVPFAYFDPEPAASYRVARTEPIAVEVRPSPTGRPAAPPDAPRGSTGPWAWIAGGVLALAIVLARLRRK